MTFVWYSTQYKKLTWEPVKTTDVAVLLHWAVRWRKICRRDSQQYVKLLKPLGSKPPPLPAGPWLGCASTRPRRWGMQRGPPLSPGNLPHWSPRCCCGSSPAGPRGKTQQSFTGGTQVALGLVSDLTVYCVRSTNAATSFSASARFQARLPAGRGSLEPALALSSEQVTFTGLSVAENASWSAQQASLHISSVNTGPAVTRTYLPQGTRKVVLNLYIFIATNLGPYGHKDLFHSFRTSLPVSYQTSWRQDGISLS